jgi:hypothetical protein
MKKTKTHTALDLARALKRYNGMDDAADAYTALHAEWPPQIANIIEPIFWTEIEIRSEKQIVADIRAMQKRAAKESAAVAKLLKGGVAAPEAVDRVIAAEKRRSKRRLAGDVRRIQRRAEKKAGAVRKHMRNGASPRAALDKVVAAGRRRASTRRKTA